MSELTATDWNVFVEGPPHGQSKPANVLKYLARYISGGRLRSYGGYHGAKREDYLTRCRKLLGIHGVTYPFRANASNLRSQETS